MLLLGYLSPLRSCSAVQKVLLLRLSLASNPEERVVLILVYLTNILVFHREVYSI